VADHARLRTSLREASLDGGSEMPQASAPAAARMSPGQTVGMAGGMAGR